MTRDREELIVPDVDPVCGLEIDGDQAREAGFAQEYEGREYVFCGPECMTGFLHDPSAYAAAGRSAP